MAAFSQAFGATVYEREATVLMLGAIGHGEIHAVLRVGEEQAARGMGFGFDLAALGNRALGLSILEVTVLRSPWVWLCLFFHVSWDLSFGIVALERTRPAAWKIV